MRSSDSRRRILDQPSTSASAYRHGNQTSSSSPPLSPTFVTRVAKQNARATNAASGNHRASARDGTFIAIPQMEATPLSADNPTLKKLAETPDTPMTPDDLLSVQNELESYAARRVKTLSEAEGGLQFIQTGEYPVDDLKTRPTPNVKYSNRLLHNSDGGGDVVRVERLAAPSRMYGSDDEEDVLPDHYDIPQHFWNWSRGYLGHIDGVYLRQFEEKLLNQFRGEALDEFFVNEPFKYRNTFATGLISTENKPKATLTRTNGSLAKSPGKRRISSESTPEVNGMQEAGLWRSPRLLRVNSVSAQKPAADIGTTIGRSLADTLPKRDNAVVSAGSRDTSQPPKKMCKKIAVDDLVNGAICNGVENMSVNGDNASSGPVGLSGIAPASNGIATGTNGFQAGALSLPNGAHKNGSSTPYKKRSVSNKMIDMELDEAGTSVAYSNGHTHVLHGDRATGLVDSLVGQKKLSLSSQKVEKHKARHQFLPQRQLFVSLLGKSVNENPNEFLETDAVSRELLQKQRQLSELEAQTKPIVDELYERLRAEYALWLTATKLEKVEKQLYRVADEASKRAAPWDDELKKECAAAFKNYMDALSEHNGSKVASPATEPSTSSAAVPIKSKKQRH